MPGRPSRWISLLLLRRDLALEPDEARACEPSRSRTSVASRSGITAVSSSTASSTSMMRCGSANSDGVRTSVARISPLRSRMSGRAVATASCAHGAAHDVAFGRRREHHQPAGDDRIDRCANASDREPDARPRLGGAVDVAAVEQRAHEPPAPRLAWRGTRSARGVGVGLRRCARRMALTSAGRGRRMLAGRHVDDVGLSIMRADRIGGVRRHQIGRPLRQIVERVELRGVDRLAA